MSAKTEKLRADLMAAGWSVSANAIVDHHNLCGWIASAKLHPDAAPCGYNSKAPGLFIYPFSTTLNGHPFEQVDFSVTGEAGGQWVCLKVYAVDMDDALDKIHAARAILSAAWTAAQEAVAGARKAAGPPRSKGA